MQTTQTHTKEATKRVSLRFPVELLKQVKKEAIDKQISLSQLFIELAKK
tara:strand:+ start:469 stop:615 length:147 start_codon:yes stop_codon:yes gene_type:complete